jgi:predicted DNA-binding transcriptional regulator
MSAGVKKSFTCCAQRPKLTQRGFPVGFLGYRQSMSPLEQFIDEVEVSISDEVLDLEQRLDALSDVLTVLASSRS